MPSVALLAGIATSAAAVLGIAAIWTAGRSTARWAFVIGMAALAFESALTAGAALQSGWLPIYRWQSWRLVGTSALIAPWVLFSVTFARGAIPRRAGYVGLLAAALALVPVAASIGREHLLAVAIDHGTGGPTLALRWGGFVIELVLLIASIAIVVNLERTFRAAIGTMRWRIKFALLGIGLIFATRIYTCSEVLLFRATDLPSESANIAAVLIAAPLIFWSFLRAGHFELAVYPSGPVLRNSVTVLVAGAYLLIVGVLAKALARLGGADAVGLKAVFLLAALVLLALGLQSDRWRWQVRRFVSRNFRRPMHDYRAVWRKFTEGTASHLEPAPLCRSLTTLVSEVFDALSVRLWLLNEPRDTFTLAASTSRAVTAPVQPIELIDAHPTLAHFAGTAEPVDIDAATSDWCHAWRFAHPSDFPHGGHRMIVPLFVRHEIVGMISVGDRVSGAAFSVEDIELLKCIADHGAGSLLNVRLSQRLSQSKQLEAFQAMAAFFVHDLKNAASTLNLMLRNLPRHFDDPAFRADALRGIGATVEHINGLVGRLSQLRHELKVQPVETDLNQVVRRALAGLGHLPDSTIEQDFRPVPRVPLDAEQVQKVITNLVLNAAEATSRDGHVRISTDQEDGWAVLTVEDNGCGMSEEFLAQSLFRPFQTTKRHGLGIGMFQTKMIVEAHGGRIAVSSRVGHGTKFQVYLRGSKAD